MMMMMMMSCAAMMMMMIGGDGDDDDHDELRSILIRFSNEKCELRESTRLDFSVLVTR